MSLPDIIEILPCEGPIRARIAVPGSKSITNRALIAAALSKGVTTLHGALWSEDTEIMVRALAQLGVEITVAPDVAEPGNRLLTIHGTGGKLLPGGTVSSPMEIFVGNAGTAARFLAALLCLGQGCYRLSGVQRMHERPQEELLSALRYLGYQIDSANGKLPVIIHGAGPRPGACSVSVQKSSQFASALLLCAKAGGWQVKVIGSNAQEAAYVRMTRELIHVFPLNGGVFQVEPDASSGSYFWGAAHLLSDAPDPWSRPTAPNDTTVQPNNVIVEDWPSTGWQIDAEFPKLIHCSSDRGGALANLPRTISRSTDLGDSIMTAIVLAPFWSEPTSFTDLGRLRVQECERVQALGTELRKCGAVLEESGDTLLVRPSRLHGCRVETYNDHRMAMCFAMLGVRVPGIEICNPACVKKTFPNFFAKLSSQSPHGLGCAIRDAQTGRSLEVAELIAV